MVLKPRKCRSIFGYNQKDTSCSSLYNTYVVRLILGREPPFLCTEIVSFACCGSGLGVVSLLSLDWYGFVCYPWGHRNALYSIVGGGRQGQGGEQDTDQAYNNSSFASHSVISLVTSHNPLMHLVIYSIVCIG